MTIVQLKNQLHNLIDKMEDVESLRQLLSFFQSNTQKNYKRLIELGEEDIAKGKTHTQEEVEDYFKRKIESRDV